jgi:hypothetical protein
MTWKKLLRCSVDGEKIRNQMPKSLASLVAQRPIRLQPPTPHSHASLGVGGRGLQTGLGEQQKYRHFGPIWPTNMTLKTTRSRQIRRRFGARIRSGPLASLVGRFTVPDSNSSSMSGTIGVWKA